MSLPNLLTLSRVPLLFLILAAMAAPGWEGVAFSLFVIAALTDWLDGWVARRRGQVSSFGKLMDALTDKILTLGMFFALVVFALLPEWTVFLVVLILARELLITGLRLVAAAKGEVLAAESTGKLKTVFQMAAIAGLLLADTLAGSNAGDALWTVGFVAFLGATVLTVLSGTLYLVKYRHLLAD